MVVVLCRVFSLPFVHFFSFFLAAVLWSQWGRGV